MMTVMTTFYHPDLGAVRGILINGEPMLACRDLAALLVSPHVEETEKIMRRRYGAKDITVPVSVSAGGCAAHHQQQRGNHGKSFSHGNLLEK